MVRGELRAYLDFVRPQYLSKDVSHDLGHILRIGQRLGDLERGLTVNSRPLLHFLVAWHGLADKIAGGSWFADATRAFLRADEWDDNAIDTAYVALVRHTSSPVTAEERIVHDANGLETLGAFGIAKAFIKGGSEGQTYEETIATYERGLEKAEFSTPRGQELALEGREFARQFLARLRSEL